MEFIPVENNKDLVRDPFTNAIINSNRTEYENYISNYNRLKKEQEDLENLKIQVSSLSSDMDEIKTLLTLLVKEKNNDSW